MDVDEVYIEEQFVAAKTFVKQNAIVSAHCIRVASHELCAQGPMVSVDHTLLGA